MLLDLAHRVGSAALNDAWHAAAQIAPRPSTLPLSAQAIADLHSQGYAVIPRWLPADEVRQLLEDALALEAGSSAAGVGLRKREDAGIRHAKHHRLHPPTGWQTTGRVAARLALSQRMHGLCEELNSGAELPKLIPWESELGYVYYPRGGFYERHKDTNGSGQVGIGSFRSGASRAAMRREVSVLLYLNANWDADEWGGQLRLYPDDGRAVDVAPEGGTLVLLRSERLEHEVLPTARARNCVVGWLRSTQAAPV